MEGDGNGVEEEYVGRSVRQQSLLAVARRLLPHLCRISALSIIRQTGSSLFHLKCYGSGTGVRQGERYER